MPVESPVAHTSDLIRVFFYGTLKRNQPNAEHLLNKNVTFVSEAVTKDKWPLIVASDCNVPFLLNCKGVGKHLHGEMYLIDHDAKAFFDDFEAVQDDLYSCLPIEVVDRKTGQTHQAYTYILDNFNEDLLSDKYFKFESYSSVNPYYPEYKKQDDTPDHVDSILAVVKTHPLKEIEIFF